jgi:hypothetical protein
MISHSLLIRIGNVADKICRENENTHFIFNSPPPPPPPPQKNHALYEICGKMW